MSGQERWAAAPNFEGWYQASTHGEIHGVDRQVRLIARGTPCTRLVRGQPLHLHRDRRGRLHVQLSRNGLRSYHDVAELVLEAFVGPPPSPEHYAQHIDGNFDNCRLENLRWAPRNEQVHQEAA